MGRKNRMKRGKKLDRQPMVSVCTPTFNRRPFIPHLIKCFQNQDYPMNRMEWIIVDDGTDKIGDLVSHIPQVKYFSLEEKVPLGKKRNIMHEKSSGSILVYMDDDDYYPPQRVSHAVVKLLNNKKALCAGTSELYIYYKDLKEMYQFGPYKSRHATAATFAFKRRLLDDHRYDDNAAVAEEKAFLNNYTVPFVQLDPLKTILVFSHVHNSYDKHALLVNKNPNYVKLSDKTVEDFICEDEFKEFFLEKIDDLLGDYEPGKPEMKPDVLEQMDELKKERQRLIAEMQKRDSKPKSEPERPNTGDIVVQQPGKEPMVLSSEQAVDIMQQQQAEVLRLSKELYAARQKITQMEIALATSTNDKIDLGEGECEGEGEGECEGEGESESESEGKSEGEGDTEKNIELTITDINP